MYNYNVKHIPLKNILDNKGGNSGLSNKYISENKGSFPVYSAKTKGDMIKGFIKTYDYDIECLQITSDGANAGTIIYREKQKFSVGPATRIYFPYDEFKNNISLLYIGYVLKDILSARDFSWTNKATKYKIDEVEIPMPIKEDGTFDLEAQVKISDKYKQIEEKKQIIIEDKERLLKMSIDVDLSEYHYINVEVQELFDLSQSSNGSKFTKGFIQENQGDIPVYGATKIPDEIGYGYVKDNAEIIENKNGKITKTKVKYFENCLTYNIDGSAGYIFYRTGRFSLSEKVRPLIIYDKYKDMLDPEYLKYIIQPIFRKNIRGRKGPNGENEFTKISKTVIQDLQIPIPIKEDGTFNLEAQKEIAEKYKQMDKIKKELCKKIDSVLEIGIDIN